MHRKRLLKTVSTICRAAPPGLAPRALILTATRPCFEETKQGANELLNVSVNQLPPAP